MRRTHALALSLLLAASPLAAQQSATDELAPGQPQPARTEAPAAAEPAGTPAPLAPAHHDKRLDVSRDEARQAMQATGDEHSAQNPLNRHPWWWLVTAVAVGVLIAVIVAG